VLWRQWICFLRKSLWGVGLGMVLAIATSGRSLAEPYNEGGEIRLGMSTALTGPAAALGLAVREGVLAGLDGANQHGGVQGRTLRLVALDDGYEPTVAIRNLHQLIERDEVMAIIGNVGTPTAVAVVPIATNFQTLFFAGFTGSRILRHDPPDAFVINYRAGYTEEIDAMIEALVLQGGIRPEEIAFFTQRDSYGDAGFTGGMAALKRQGHPNPYLAPHVRYERNSLAVEDALVGLLFAEPPPRAVVMVGAYAPCAKFIRLAWQSGLHVIFLNVSFVGSEPLAAALDGITAPVIVTQVVPHPLDVSLPAVRKYHEDLRRLDPEAKPGFASLEGHIATQILLLAMGKAQLKPNRLTLVRALDELGDFDVGLGVPLHLSPTVHQASHSIWPTSLRQGAFVPFAWTNLARWIKEQPQR
jgi:ABC-type branched-subunit amino acid transport system substrate-binding protein